MITYVINTSKNKTLDDNLLFDLAGYSKIHWLFSSLDAIEGCADTIVKDQNKLIGDSLRVAVILDFYGYDRIRLPYDSEPDKVHVDVYKPFLLAYLVKNLFHKIQKRGCRITSCEVFYIQSDVDGSSESAANRNEEISYIFSLNAQKEAFRRANLSAPVINEDDPDADAKKEEYRRQKEADEKILAEEFERFTLYLTEEDSLSFSAKEYCYRDKASIGAFVDAIRILMLDNKSIVHHIHPTTGEMSVHAAYDNLTLSFNLIREYESPSHSSEGSEKTVIVEKLDKEALKVYLRTAYAKIDAAREKAVDDRKTPRYYTLTLPESTQRKTKKEETLLPDLVDENIEVDAMYQNILTYASHGDSGMDPEDVKELDALVKTYISARHDKRMSEVEREFADKIAKGNLKKTEDSCPTEDDYRRAIGAKRSELEALLATSLDAEYVNVPFDEEKKRADKAYEKYHAAKADQKAHLVGDCLLFLITLLAMIIPYAALQCYEAPFALKSIILYGIAAGVFGGLLIFSYFVHLLPAVNRMHRAENEMRAIYRSCLEKRQKAFAKLQKRYEQQLLDIETIRYEIRQIEELHRINREIFQNITLHRVMLEKVAVVLKSMMSHLDIPINYNYDTESVEDEFFPDEGIMSDKNRIYKILSLENIKNLFLKEGR
ncbi:MAG: hypothetical protein IJW46_02500 [Clostridia bacterium]|nr:hypothetical protein [Clostridia bacterium]